MFFFSMPLIFLFFLSVQSAGLAALHINESQQRLQIEMEKIQRSIDDLDTQVKDIIAESKELKQRLRAEESKQDTSDPSVIAKLEEKIKALKDEQAPLNQRLLVLSQHLREKEARLASSAAAQLSAPNVTVFSFCLLFWHSLKFSFPFDWCMLAMFHFILT